MQVNRLQAADWPIFMLHWPHIIACHFTFLCGQDTQLSLERNNGRTSNDSRRCRPKPPSTGISTPVHLPFQSTIFPERIALHVGYRIGRGFRKWHELSIKPYNKSCVLRRADKKARNSHHEIHLHRSWPYKRALAHLTVNRFREWEHTLKVLACQ